MPNKRSAKKGGNNCNVRALVDRVQFRARRFFLQLLLNAGFKRIRDGFVRSQTSIATYRRVATYSNRRTNTTLNVQYDPACPWLWALKGSVFPDDRFGLSRRELQVIFDAFIGARLLTVELALDFAANSAIDRGFVLRHGVFGKSRPIRGRLYKDLRYGSHRSDIFVRAYEKPEIESYRVESQLESGWLRARGIQRLGDLAKLPAFIVPARVCFVGIDWDAVARNLSRKKIAADPIVQEAQRRGRSLHTALEFLRHDVGVPNVHRFLRPLAINEQILGALQEWARQWADQGEG